MDNDIPLIFDLSKPRELIGAHGQGKSYHTTMDQTEFWNDMRIDQAIEMESKCFSHWRSGRKFGVTFRAHCLEYFTPDANTLNILAELPDAQFALTMYRICLNDLHSTIERFTDEQAEEVYSVWKERNPD